MEKLSLIHKSIIDPLELKKLVVTIFLLTYKIEGFNIGKMTINTLIDAFLKSLCIDREELSNQIIQTELKNDSIVRGSTSKKIVKMLKEAGAKDS